VIWSVFRTDVIVFINDVIMCFTWDRQYHYTASPILDLFQWNSSTASNFNILNFDLCACITLYYPYKVCNIKINKYDKNR
jgi:hypothetical protein